MTKSEIIQRLLDEKNITVEEAMILMASEPTPMPINPYNPYSPPFTPGDWTWDPNKGPVWYTSSTGFNYDNEPKFEE